MVGAVWVPGWLRVGWVHVGSNEGCGPAYVGWPVGLELVALGFELVSPVPSLLSGEAAMVRACVRGLAGLVLSWLPLVLSWLARSRRCFRVRVSYKVKVR